MIISFLSWRGGAGDDNRMMRQSVILGVLSKYCGLKRLIPPVTMLNFRNGFNYKGMRA